MFVILSGSYTVEEKEDKVYNLDTELTKVKINPTNENILNLLNGSSFCGIDNWKDGITQDVTSTSGEGACRFGAFPREEFNIMKYQDKGLYFGQTEIEGILKENYRPDTINEEKRFEKTW